MCTGTILRDAESGLRRDSHAADAGAQYRSVSGVCDGTGAVQTGHRDHSTYPEKSARWIKENCSREIEAWTTSKPVGDCDP